MIHVPDATIGSTMRIAALILLAALLFVGFWPKSVSEGVNVAVSALYQK